MNNTDSAEEIIRQAVEAALGPLSEGRDNGLSGPAPEESGSTPDTGAGGSVSQSAGAEGADSLLGLISALTPVAAATSGSSTVAQVVSMINPILGGILSLFGGGDDTAPATLLPYVARPSQSYTAGFGETNAGIQLPIQRDELGVARGNAGGSQGVVVQVQAMDSQSFMDHAPEIAQAVKQALLESNGLASVIQEI